MSERLASKAALESELQSLLLTAFENGVDVRGGFECRNGEGHPDWDIIITEVEKPGADER